MTAKYFAILTNYGAAQLANAVALGTQMNISAMGAGDGGGTLPVPDPAQTTLIRENRRAAVNQVSVDDKNPNIIIAEQVIPENEGGWWIREIGLYDDNGGLIAVGNVPETYKPNLQEGSGRTQVLQMALIVSSTQAITLKVDPSVVLATREYVTKSIDAAIQASETRAAKTYATKKEVGLKLDKSAVVQATGPSTTNVMSQKAVTELANTKQPAGTYADGNAFKRTSGTVSMSSPDGINSLALRNDGMLYIWDGAKAVFSISDTGEIIAGEMAYSRLTDVPVVQSTGVSTTSFMSQKAVTDLANTKQPKGNYADGEVFKKTSANASISPPGGVNSLTLRSDGLLHIWDGEKSVFSISNTGEIIAGEMAYSRLTGVPVVQSTGVSTTSFMSQKAVTDALNNTFDYPVGSPIPWPKSTAPGGFLICNGQSFNKVTYPLLASAYPSGILPDLRGEFIRGLDSGRGVDSGRAVLSGQGDAIRNITGSIYARPAKTTGASMFSSSGAFVDADASFTSDSVEVSTAKSTMKGSDLDISRVVPTASENRPRNTAFLYIVRAA